MQRSANSFAKYCLVLGFGAIFFHASCTLNPTTPIVKTKQVTLLPSGHLMSGGDVLDDGGSEIFQKGVIVSHDSNPDMSPSTGGWGVDGHGNGSWNSEIIGGVELQGTVYVRSYAINGAGVGYGDVASITF